MPTVRSVYLVQHRESHEGAEVLAVKSNRTAAHAHVRSLQSEHYAGRAPEDWKQDDDNTWSAGVDMLEIVKWEVLTS